MKRIFAILLTLVPILGTWTTAIALPYGAVARLGKGSISDEDRAAQFSPDGTLLAVATSIGVYLYDAQTHDEVAFLETNAMMSSVAFSPDGRILASGSDDGTIKLWDVSQRKLIDTLTGHTDYVTSVSFSPDGRILASGSLDNTIKLWDVSQRKLIDTLTGHTDYVFSVSFSPDGRIIASGSRDATIKLWDVSQRKLIDTLTAGGVSSVSFSPDVRLLASGSWDNTIKLWDVSQRKLIDTLTGHTFLVLSVAFSPDGKIIASGSDDDTIKLWDVSQRKLIDTLTGHTYGVFSVAFSPDGRTLASGSFDNTIKLWDVSQGKLIDTLTGHTKWVSSVAFSPDGSIIASGSYDNTIKLWDVSQRKLIITLTGHTDPVSSVSFSSDGSIIASGSYDNTIKLWDVSQRKLITTLTGHTDGVFSVAFSPDGRILASGSYDNTIKFWDVSQRKLIDTLTGHTDYVTSVAFSPDGRILASGSLDGTIKFWDVSQRKLITTLWQTGGVSSVSFSPDGRIIASGSGATIKLWDVSQRKLITTLTGHTDPVFSVAFSPDRRIIASGGYDETIKLWDVSQGKLIDTLTGHTSGVNFNSVSFSPDGSLLASGSWDGTILLWDMEPYISPVIEIAKVAVQATPNQLLADGKSTSTITVQVEDAQGNPVITDVELDANGTSKICWMFDSSYDEWVNTKSMGEVGHEGDDYYADDWAKKDGDTKGQIAYAGINGQAILLPFDQDGYGNHVVIYDSSSKFALRYAHLDEILVKDGQNVIAGYTPIGKVGSTGLSTGPHLHVVLYKNVQDVKNRPITSAHVPIGEPIDPPTNFAAPFLYNPIVTLTATSGKVESPALNQGGGAYTSTYTAFSTAGEVTITATTSNSKKGTVTITLTEAVITSGFTPDSDGYSFRNFSDPSLFVWDVFRDTFGKEQVEYGDTGIHKPIADIFFVEHYLPFIGHQVLGGGVCNGMAAASLLFFENPSTLAKFSATAQNTNQLEPTHELKYHIEVYQGYQLGLLIKDWKANQDKDPATLFNIIKNSLKKSPGDQQVINIYGKYNDKMAGHSVAPYKIEEKGNNIYWVYVYDCNYPFASAETDALQRKIVFNLDKHSWEYEFTSGVIWTGDDKNQWMNLVPLAFYHEQPILIVGLFGGVTTADYGATQSIEGAAHLLFEDNEGRRLGYVNGELVSEIPGAIPIIPSAGAADAPYPETYYISKKAKLQPKILETGKGSYDFSIYTTNTMFKLDDVTTTGDGADTLEVSDGGNSIKFSTTSESKGYTAILIREQKDVARSYTISDTTISKDGEVVFQASEDLSSFSLVNRGSEKTFDLNIEQSGTEARAFVAKGLSIGANETQKVDVQNWSKLEQVPLIISIDKGNDGTIDDVQTVKSLPTWDVNCDGRVDIFDLALVVTHFGERIIYTKIENPDVNRDGVVDIADLALVGRHLGK